MRIAVDAKWFWSGPAGPRTHVRGILGALSQLDHQNDYLVFVRHRDKTTLPGIKNLRWEVKRLWPDLSLPRVWWSLPHAAGDAKIIWTQSYLPHARNALRVVTVHDVLWHDFPEFFTLQERMYFRFIDVSVKHADLVMTVSEYSKQRIVGLLGRNEERIAVVPNGVDVHFRPVSSNERKAYVRMRYGLPDRFVLYVGRINMRKNLPTLFQAVATLPSEWKLVCVGARDWKQDALARILRDLKMTDRVVFPGFVDDADLPAVYSSATIFAYVPYAEGFGLPPLEAMACGVPVLASNTTSLPEVVGDAGILVEPRDVRSVSDALHLLVEDETLRADLSKRGLERAALFTWEQAARRVLQLWQKLAR